MVLDINFLIYLSDIWPGYSMTASALSKNEEKLYTLVLSWFFSTCSHRPWITSLNYNNHLADCLFWERISSGTSCPCLEKFLSWYTHMPTQHTHSQMQMDEFGSSRGRPHGHHCLSVYKSLWYNQNLPCFREQGFPSPFLPGCQAVVRGLTC